MSVKLSPCVPAAGLLASAWTVDPAIVTASRVNLSHHIWSTAPTTTAVLANLAITNTSGNLPGIGLNDYTIVRIQGRILLPANGSYTISLRSDDSALLFMDSQLLISNDPFCPPATCPNGTAVTFAGSAGYHDIDIRYFEYTHAAYLELFWESATLKIPRTHIPPGAFSRLAVAPTGELHLRLLVCGTMGLARISPAPVILDAYNLSSHSDV